jgi:hypothetical protein
MLAGVARWAGAARGRAYIAAWPPAAAPAPAAAVVAAATIVPEGLHAMFGTRSLQASLFSGLGGGRGGIVASTVVGSCASEVAAAAARARADSAQARAQYHTLPARWRCAPQTIPTIPAPARGVDARARVAGAGVRWHCDEPVAADAPRCVPLCEPHSAVCLLLVVAGDVLARPSPRVARQPRRSHGLPLCVSTALECGVHRTSTC